jgi:hypothetical protein
MAVEIGAVRARDTAATLFRRTCTFLSLYNYKAELSGYNKGFEFFQERRRYSLTNSLHYYYYK